MPQNSSQSYWCIELALQMLYFIVFIHTGDERIWGFNVRLLYRSIMGLLSILYWELHAMFIKSTFKEGSLQKSTEGPQIIFIAGLLGWAAGHSTVLIWPHNLQIWEYSCCWISDTRSMEGAVCCFGMEEGKKLVGTLWYMQPVYHLNIGNTSLYSPFPVVRPVLYHRRKQQIEIKESTGISGNAKVRFYLRVENLF